MLLITSGGLWMRSTLDEGVDIDMDVNAGAEFDIAQQLRMI